MKNYRFLAQITILANKINIYLDSNNKYFYLKVNKDNGLEYLDIKELLYITMLFRSVPNIALVEGKMKKIIPKVIIKGVAVTLTPIILMTIFSMNQSKKRLDEISDSSVNNNYEISIAEDDLYNDELVVDTFLQSENPKFTFIYDMEYLDKVLNYETVKKEQIISVVENNNSISPKFKKIIYSYINSLFEKYPTIDYRVLYENLKTLKIIECDKKELVKQSLSMNSYGCYIRTENNIYVLKDYEYKEKTWAYQIIFHELSHCLRTGVWDNKGEKIRVQVEGQNFNNVITAEALNSLFTVSLFDYEEKNIAYQLQSNYHKIIIDCMDNYNLSDYVNHSLSYYAKKLDEFNKDDNYATIILNLIQLQYDDFHNDKITVKQEEYYPIYEYISKMYYNKYASPNMTYYEIKEITEELISKITYDVPKEYNIDISYFENFMEEYCQENNIVRKKI